MEEKPKDEDEGEAVTQPEDSRPSEDPAEAEEEKDDEKEAADTENPKDGEVPQKQPPRRVPRAGEPDFDGDSKYAIVSSDGKAVNVTGPGWQNHIKVEAAYQEDGNKVFDEKAQFIIKPTEGTDLASSDITAEEGEVIVQITCPIGGDVYPFRVEGGNDYAFADSDGRYDKKPEIYVIKADSGKSGACTIKAASNGRYATVDNGELRFNAGTGEEQAERFRF